MANWTVPLWVVVQADTNMEAYEKAEEMADLLYKETGTSVNAGDPIEVTGEGGH